MRTCDGSAAEVAESLFLVLTVVVAIVTCVYYIDRASAWDVEWSGTVMCIDSSDVSVSVGVVLGDLAGL